MHTARNELSGGAGAVVQAGTVHGGVNLFGRREPPPPPPRQLPLDTARFVNREQTLTQLDATLPAHDDATADEGTSTTIATIAGAPGVGKTALAVHWAHRARTWFTDGDLYVDMRGYGPGPALDVGQALNTFLRALHVPAEQIPTDTDGRAALYRSALTGKRILIVVDNVSTVGQVRPLLPATPTCMAIITSRSRLSGLIAREGASRMTLDVLSPEEAIALLSDSIGGDRVRAEPQAAGELARRCAYLPLALRIIGERIANAPYVTLAEFVADLALADHQLDALTIGDDELSDVRAVFSWSYSALPEDAARFFRLLGLHAGSDISVAAAAAAAGVSLPRARSLLDQLTAAHLMQNPARDRYLFHDLLRAYALERAQAEETPEQQRQSRRRGYTWYLWMAEEGRKIILPYSHAIALPAADPDVPLTPVRTVAEAMAWFEQERLNLLDTIRQADELGDHDIAWQLPVVSDGFFELKSYWADWRDVHLTGLRAARSAASRLGEAANFRCLGDAYWRMEQRETALDCYRQGVDASRDVGDHWVEGFCLRGLGLIHEELGQIDQAMDLYRQAREVFRHHGITRGEGMSLLSLGNCHRAREHLDTAIAHYQEAVSILGSINDQWSIAWASYPLGLAYQRAGQLDEALRQHQRALELFRRFDDRRCEGLTLAALGDTFHATGQTDDAQRCWQQALQILDPLGDPHANAVRRNIAQHDMTKGP
ncbi:NB-ARC domain protein [Micromonospora sp. L5]|uniref:ATP-binding protein n=1 Tax=Micromonospora TaxID=1873 RepID=UPI0001C46E7B|nr:MULTISPECIES: tetratricopeptide repeat protein [Micromonospora]ADU09752.1 NB-ARC domain protein [Micromonospora sp. L5]MBC9005200.1 tetratricopeptide repeat protein [Micromonospora aurantiaca]RBJ11678.1 nb-arc domain-containing protein [Micromonospora provocatoris]